MKRSANISPTTTVKLLGMLASLDFRTVILLNAAEVAKFDVLLTVDRGFEYQQNLEHRKIAVIIFCGKSVLFEDLVPLVPACLAYFEDIRPGQVLRIGGD